MNSTDLLSTSPLLQNRRSLSWLSAQNIKRAFIPFLVHEMIIVLAFLIPLPAHSRSWIQHNMAFGSQAHFLFQWDSLFFINIAHSGYSHLIGNAAFFPMLPVIIWVTGKWGALFLTQVVLFLILLLLPKVLSILGLGETQTNKAIWLFAVNPAEVFYSALYAEAYTMLGALLVITLLENNRKPTGMVTAFFAALTQGPALLTGSFPLVIFIFGIIHKKAAAVKKSFIIGSGFALGFIAFAIYMALLWHNSDIIFHVQALWGQSWMLPWHQLLQAIPIIVAKHDVGLLSLWLAVLVFTIGSLYWLVYVARSMGQKANPLVIGSGLYMLLGLLVSLSFGMKSYPFHSSVRFFSDYFPVYGGLAIGLSNPWLYVIGMVFFVVMALMGATLFVHSWAYQ